MASKRHIPVSIRANQPADLERMAADLAGMHYSLKQLAYSRLQRATDFDSAAMCIVPVHQMVLATEQSLRRQQIIAERMVDLMQDDSSVRL